MELGTREEEPLAAGAARPPGRSRRLLGWGLLLTLALLGFLLVLQARSQQMLGGLDLQARSVDELGGLIGTLSQEVERLQDEATDLKSQLAARESLFHSDTALTSQEELNLEALELVTGRRSGRGPGVVLEISDEQGKLTPFEFEAMVSELRSSGAEAIVIDGTRVEFDSFFGTAGDKLTLNGRELEPPYIVQAVGDQDDLVSSLELPGGLLSNLRALPGVKAPLYREDRIVVPARDQDDLVFEYARRAEN